MRKLIICGTLLVTAFLVPMVVHSAPSGSGMYQLTLAKWKAILTGSPDATHIVDGSDRRPCCRVMEPLWPTH